MALMFVSSGSWIVTNASKSRIDTRVKWNDQSRSCGSLLNSNFSKNTYSLPISNIAKWVINIFTFYTNFLTIFGLDEVSD